MTVGRVWAVEESTIQAELAIEATSGVNGRYRVTFEIQGPDRTTHGTGTATSANPNARASSRAVATAWHAIVLKSSGLPQEGVPFTVTVEYTAPQTITPEEF